MVRLQLVIPCLDLVNITENAPQLAITTQGRLVNGSFFLYGVTSNQHVNSVMSSFFLNEFLILLPLDQLIYKYSSQLNL